MSDDGQELTNTEEEEFEEEVEEVDEVKALASKHSPEELASMVKRYRGEAAGRRKSESATKKELEEFRAYKESQKTELQREREKRQELENELKQERIGRLQRSAARKAGLPVSFADRLRGENEEELLEDAKALAADRRSSSKSGIPATNGTPVGGQAASDGDKWLRAQFYK